jgi:D-3-phosphoglycerate dehydrogenase / 2-oxoglutarate reductase
MNDFQILVTESKDFPLRAALYLQSIGRLTLADLDRESLLKEIMTPDILWVRLRHYINKEIMERASNLRIIVTPTTGLTHIDMEEADKRKINILSLRGETIFLKNIHATAELTLTLALLLLRNIIPACEHALHEKWNRDPFKGREVFGKTVGLVGYGRIGKIVAAYFLSLGAKILASDPNITPHDVNPGVSLVALDTLLAESDIVTLHVNLNNGNKGFFNENCFKQMKSRAFFINTSRGELIDENALIRFLANGHLAGAALDVISGEHTEYFKTHPVIEYAAEHSNLVITPHIGGCTYESLQMTEEYMAIKLKNFLCGKVA